VILKKLRTFVFKLKTNKSNMSTLVANRGKSHMGFRFRNDLVGVIKEEAKRENRSINNFMENLLVHYFSVDEKVPNATTRAAIEEARAGKSAGRVDTSSLEAFIKSCEE
jgi:hypothetical protein